MTVKELIEELKKMPQDLTVEFSLYDGWGGREEVSIVQALTIYSTLEEKPIPNVVLLS